MVLQHHDAAVYDDTSQHETTYGESIATDPFLGPMLSREHYFLNKLIPRQENVASILRATCSVWTLSDTACAIFLLSIVGVTTGVCSGSNDNVCSEFEVSDYTTAILNTLASFLLGFYCSLATREYSIAYQQCQVLKQRTVDLVTLAAGTMDDDPRTAQLQMDIWRSANLMHLAAYTLADKASAFEVSTPATAYDPKRIYSIDTFVIPVASAYGLMETVKDGWRGMLREKELDYLVKSQYNDLTGEGNVTNSRGDVRTRAAFIDNAFSVRIIRLVQYAIKERLTSAAWPVWAAAIRNQREATSAISRRALPRVRTLYRVCVSIVVRLALAADALKVGTKVGMTFAGESGDPAAATTYAAIFLVIIVVTIQLLLQFCQNLEQPLGADPMDLPVLSYVMASAEVSLRQIRQPTEERREAMRLFTRVDDMSGGGPARVDRAQEDDGEGLGDPGGRERDDQGQDDDDD